MKYYCIRKVLYGRFTYWAQFDVNRLIWTGLKSNAAKVSHSFAVKQMALLTPKYNEDYYIDEIKEF